MKTTTLILLFAMIFAYSLSSQTIVSGNVTGIWETSGNPYIVTGNVYVIDSLIIEAGVNVKFQAGGWMIQCGGGSRFLANGTHESPITFEPYQGNEPGMWNALYFVDSGNDDTLKYCKIKCASTGVYIQSSTTVIINSEINNNLTGVFIYFGTGIIIGCEIYDNIYGINDQGVALADIYNCTIFNNTIGVHAAWWYTWEQGDAKITNSIIAFNKSVGVSNSGGGCIGAEDLLYNCFWGNGINNFEGIGLPNGFGTNGDYENYNEDSCDINFNIYNDPVFVDTTNANFNLQPASKCIDAGTNILFGQFTYDPDGTMPDMGANYYDQTTEIKEAYSNQSELIIYPNPVTDKAIIRFENTYVQEYSLKIFDLSGKMIYNFKFIKSDYYLIDRGSLPSGIYIVELRGDKTYRCKMIIK